MLSCSQISLIARLDGIVLCIAEDIHTQLSSKVLLGKCYALCKICQCRFILTLWLTLKERAINLHVSLCLSSVFIFTAYMFVATKMQAGHHHYNKMQLSDGNYSSRRE